MRAISFPNSAPQRMPPPRAPGLWLLLGAMALSPSILQAGQEPLPLADLVNIEFRTDARLFCVMAALNAAGFDYEQPGLPMSSVRLKVRARLERLAPELKDRLRSFYSEHRTGRSGVDHQTPYVSLALLLTAPPDFKLNVPQEDIPPEARQVKGFEFLVREVYRAADLATLWQDHQQDHWRELDQYGPVVRKAVEQTLSYFRIPPRIALDRRIILSPDLLNAHNIVNARNMENIYYLVVGPTRAASANFRQLQHEYLHSVIDPLVQKSGASLLKHRKLLELAWTRTRLKPEYRDNFLLVVTESLLESIRLRLHPPQNLDHEMVNLFDQGLFLVPYFQRQLQAYEESDLISFPAYLEGILQGIRESDIREDGRSMASLAAAVETARAEARQAEQAVLTRAAKSQRLQELLEEAGDLLSREAYQSARQKLDQLLAQEPEHGGALFYLGQMASQEGDQEAAFGFYRRAVDSPSTPGWVRAWAMLRMGRYLAYTGDREAARQRLTEVLNMQGDLRGAREAARDSLNRLDPP